MGSAPSLAAWIMQTWVDLATAGALGVWFSFIAHIARRRGGKSTRTGIKCLIADCLIGATSAEIALVSAIAANTSTLGTVLAVALAGYLGQAALDKAAGNSVWRTNHSESIPVAPDERTADTPRPGPPTPPRTAPKRRHGD